MAGQRPRLAILDVGHGSAAVLVDRDGVVVIDTGPRAALVSLLEYLRQCAIVKVNVVLLSHADEDHLGGLSGLLSAPEIAVERVRVNSDAAKGSATWKDVVYELDCRSRRGQVDFVPALHRGQGETYCQGDVYVEVVGPTAAFAAIGPGGTDSKGRRISSNSASAVIRLSHREGRAVLLCGDLDQRGLDELLRIDASLAADVLVFPHHGGHARGSSGAFAAQLMERVAPSVVIFSNGRGKYDTPRPDIVTAIREHSPGLRLMCTQLSERCATTLPSGPPAHVLDAFAWGRRQGACCAGTIVIPFDIEAQPRPAEGEHRSFIAASAPTALCRPPAG